MRKQPVTQPKKTDFELSDASDVDNSSEDDDEEDSIAFPEGDDNEYGSEDGKSVGSIDFGSDDEEEDEDETNDDDDNDNDDEEEPSSAATNVINKKKKGKENNSNDRDRNNEDTFYQKFDPVETDRLILKSHPQLAVIGSAEMSAMSRIVRDRTGKIADPMHQTMPFLTKYESTTVIGTRAEQIEQGAPPFVDLPDSVIDSYTIAKMEFDAGVLPFIISRPMPDGTVEYWNLSDLERLH